MIVVEDLQIVKKIFFWIPERLPFQVYQVVRKMENCDYPKNLPLGMAPKFWVFDHPTGRSLRIEVYRLEHPQKRAIT
jgi:hypothetical protein